MLSCVADMIARSHRAAAVLSSREPTTKGTGARMRVLRIASLVLCLVCPSAAFAQDASPDASRGIPVPDSERLRVNVRFMASYGNDESHYGIGNESQGRVG